MRAAPLSLAVICAVGLTISLTRLPGDASTTPSTEKPPAFLGFSPPPWLDGEPLSAWALADLEGAPLNAEGPRIQSQSAFIADLDQGEVLWAKDPDTPRSVASLTKLVSALALMSEEPDLDAWHCVGPEHYPTRPGARSRFETGVCHVGWDWLGAALTRSDNRGAMGLAAMAELHYPDFVRRMNEVSEALGMQRAHWVEPSGIEDENTASARDMARAVVATAAHSTLAPIASAAHWRVERARGAELLASTNRLVQQYETLSAKTGFTAAAGYCFAVVVRSPGGATLVAVVLGAPSSNARFLDVAALIAWADARWTSEQARNAPRAAGLKNRPRARWRWSCPAPGSSRGSRSCT